MRISIPAIVLAVAASAALAQTPEGFQTSWSKAQALAKSQNKLIYAHFTTTWCPWCRKIEKDVYATPQGRKALADFVPVSLDCTVAEGQKPAGETKINLDLLEKFGGEGFPYLVMATPDGEVLNTVSGYLPVDEFAKQLQNAKANYDEYKSFQQYAATADKKSYEYNVKAMKIYARLHKNEATVEAAKAVLALDPDNAKGNNAEANLRLIQMADTKETPAATAAYLQAVKKLDPKNEKGFLEKAYIAQAERHFAAFRLAEEEGGKEHLRAILTLSDEALAGGWKVSKLEDFYGMQIFANLQLGDKDAALAAARKLLASDPNGPRAAQLKDLIGRLEAMPTSNAAK